MALFVLFLSSVIAFGLVSATRNITIDDTNSQIVYNGTWQPSSSHLSPLDYGGSHTTSNVQGSTATLKFTGVAVYFVSPLWPYNVTTVVTLDSGQPVVLDLTDHSIPDRGSGSETRQSQAVWGATGLSSTQHTVVVSIDPAGSYAVVDAFIYSVEDLFSPVGTAQPPASTSPSSSSTTIPVISPTSSTSSSPSARPSSRSSSTPTASTTSSPSSSPSSSFSRSVAASTASSSTSPASTSSSSKRTAIVVGIIVGILILVIAAILFALCCRRRDKRKSFFGSKHNHHDTNVLTGLPEDAGPPPMIPPRPDFLYGPEHRYSAERRPGRVHNVPPPPMVGMGHSPLAYGPNQLTPISEASSLANSQRRSRPASGGAHSIPARSSGGFSYATDRTSQSHMENRHHAPGVTLAVPSESSFGDRLPPNSGENDRFVGGFRPGSPMTHSSVSEAEFGRRSIASPRKSGAFIGS